MIEAILSGGWKSISVAAVLVLMSVASVAALITEVMRLRQELASIPRGGTEATGIWLAIRTRHDTMRAAGYKGMAMLDRLENSISSHISATSGPSTILASIGANAPYVGLFGTVMGVYGALTVIGRSVGVLSPDDIAAPVGEALVMTAIGLVVAIPAVFSFNYVIRLRTRLEEGLRAYAMLLATGCEAGPHIRTLDALAKRNGGR